MQIIKWTVLLSIFWLLLSGFIQPLLLSFGVLSVFLVIYIINRMDSIDKEKREIGTGIRLMQYTPWLLGQIMSSSTQVTQLIWGPPNRFSPTLAKISAKNVPLKNKALYANSITLTPGTLSIDIDEDEITVHALQASSIEELKKRQMEQKITSIWRAEND